jgi:hypothetical protein
METVGMTRQELMLAAADPETRKQLTVSELMDAMQFAIEDIAAFLDRRDAEKASMLCSRRADA